MGDRLAPKWVTGLRRNTQSVTTHVPKRFYQMQRQHKMSAPIGAGTIENKFLELLNVNEAAVYLRVKQSTLYGWVHSRKIPHRKHGSKLVFCTEELQKWSQTRSIPCVDEILFTSQGNSVSVRPSRKRGRSLTIEQNGGQKAKSAEGGL
jgi:excisionase family DNA binding protein